MTLKYNTDPKFEDLSEKARAGLDRIRKLVKDPPAGFGVGIRSLDFSFLSFDRTSADRPLTGPLDDVLYTMLLLDGCEPQDMVNAVSFARKHNFWVYDTYVRPATRPMGMSFLARKP